MKKKLYIGCALTVVPPEKRMGFVALIEEVKKELRNHFEVMDFLGLGDFTPKEVYNFDIKECVMKADYMLAICDYPSLGLGYEMATAIEKLSIPVLAVAHKDAVVAKLIRGIDHKNFHFIYYDSVDEIIEKTLEILTK
jgi:hypothetical protein